jgi:hypothetical protein
LYLVALSAVPVCEGVCRFSRLIRQAIDGLPTTGDGSLTDDLRIRQR